MKNKRRRARIVKIGRVCIGDGYPVAIQSMAKIRTSDVDNAVRQIKELERCGCEIVRVAVKDIHDARSIKAIKQRVGLPIVADIHFNWRLAIDAIDSGADKIRLNPGNIFKKEQVRQIAGAAKSNGIAIRVGLNSGSLPGANSYHRTSEAKRMVEGALNYIKILEGVGFSDIVVSLKASDVTNTIEAYRLIARLCDYPLHLGVTATGLPYSGTIKSSIALGVLLSEGIGDTIRVSLTDKPQSEVRVAKAILESLGLRSFGPEVISCPTCGRCEVDLIKIVSRLEEKLCAKRYTLKAIHPLKIAVMGCIVNGPGEAKAADIGVAFGKDRGLLFKNGKAIKKVSAAGCLDLLLKEMGRRDA